MLEQCILIDVRLNKRKRWPHGQNGSAGKQSCDLEAGGDLGGGRGAAVLDTGMAVWREESMIADNYFAKAF